MIRLSSTWHAKHGHAVQPDKEGLMSAPSLSEFSPNQTAVLLPSTAELPDQATQAAHNALANPGLIHLRRRLGLSLLNHSPQTSQQQQPQPQQKPHMQHSQAPQQEQGQRRYTDNSSDQSPRQLDLMQESAQAQHADQNVASEVVQTAPARFQTCKAEVKLCIRSIIVCSCCVPVRLILCCSSQCYRTFN